MAILRSVLGNITGSMGGVTASNWKGRNVLKQKVPATNTSNSPAQAKQRTMFGTLAILSGAVGPAIRIGFNDAATTITEQNVFQSRNAQYVTEAGGIVTVAYTSLSVSSGVVLQSANMLAVYDGVGGNVSVSWDDNTNGTSALPTDQAQILVVNKVTGESWFQSTTARRDDAGFDIIVGTGATKANLVAYLFFKRFNSTATSPSTAAQVL